MTKPKTVKLKTLAEHIPAKLRCDCGGYFTDPVKFWNHWVRAQAKFSGSVSRSFARWKHARKVK